jgi:hypothetical protein
MPRLKAIFGAAVALAVLVLVAGCGGGSDSTGTSGEPFEPQASLTAVGGTARTAKPRFVMRVDARPGDASIRSAKVLLPPVVFIDAEAIGKLCSKSELKANDCKGRQRMGTARVVSPAFSGPLSGPVYAVTGYGGLPQLAYVLSGPANVTLHGKIVTESERIQAGLEDLPDTPLKSFEFSIDGGKSGYLIVSRDLCKNEIDAKASFTSQEGRVYEQQFPLEAECN